MDIYNLTLTELRSMPTITQGMADDLKYENELTRVWLSRLTVDDGEPYANAVYIETYSEDEGWMPTHRYEANA